MSKARIVYDFSKYIDFLFQPTPSGIATVDLAYAHFLTDNPERFAAGIHDHFGIKTVFSLSTLRRLIATVDHNWDESYRGGLVRDVERWLHSPSPDVRRIRATSHPKKRFRSNIWKLATGWPWHNALVRIPKNAIYLNTAYANTSRLEKFSWLDKRPDIKPVFMVFDLIPIDFPEYFWDGHDSAFPEQIATILRYAKIVFVTATAVAERLDAYAREHGRHDLVIHNIPLPPAPSFLAAPTLPLERTLPPYFVMCGTIEPRKNHVLLLNLWREMAQECVDTGRSVPKLLVIGNRGWKNEQVIDLIERSPSLGGHVLEVSDLSTVEMKHLVRHAQALLMPSFAEGFGLPIAEALSLGTPVIASDIPVFREVSQGCARLVDPLDGLGWKQAILALGDGDLALAQARSDAARFVKRNWNDYFAEVSAVLDSAVSVV